MNSLDLFKGLADKSRLKIIHSLMEEDMVAERLAKRLDLAASTVSFHLKKLEELELVTSEKDQYYKTYKLNTSVFDKSLRELLKAEKDPVVESREAQYRRQVLDTFMKDGHIEQLPVQRKKRLIILDAIAKDFKENREYPETEVNDMLKNYHDDFCTLRRDLVDFRYLTRKDGIYKKHIKR